MGKEYDQIPVDISLKNGSRHFVLFLMEHVMVGLHSEGHNPIEKDKMRAWL